MKLSQTEALLKLIAKAVPQTEFKLSLFSNPPKPDATSESTSPAPVSTGM